MNLLLVEDDEALGALIQYKLKKAFHSVDWVTDAETAQSYFDLGHYDAYIFDWMLPKGSGIDLIMKRREQLDQTPILMLTARDAVADRVAGLKHGADDYLIKPFAFEELIARIEGLARRGTKSWTDRKIAVGDLSLNPDTLEASRGGQILKLARREFQLLEYLMRNAGLVLSREQIIEGVWGFAEVTPNAVDSTIKLLRKKVDDPFDSKYIQSYRGVGYAIRPEASGDV